MHNTQKSIRSSNVFKVAKGLVNQLVTPTKRAEFFATLTALLEEQFHFDRLCINLYNQETGRLTLFADAEGTVVSSLSSLRVAGENTVAGKVIASRGPLVITNIARYFSESEIHPLTEAGLSTTMAFPLVVNDQLMGTLHCSFQHEPDYLYAYTEFLLELCPFIASSLALILTLEHTDIILQPHDNVEFSDKERFIVGTGIMNDLLQEVQIVAKLDIPILILGETGTGKTLLAQHIHRLSNRKFKNFVKVNCPALVPSLFESELFGHAKGAFTGAATKRIGRFEHAHNGTLFLDEIAELSPEMQSKLLHALEEKSFERVGETSSLSVDTRLITATNVNIPEALEKGTLRSDFYYRLASYTISLPPLRERKDDVLPLFTYLGEQISKNLGIARLKPSEKVKEALKNHSWRGNVRELKNIIQQLLIQQAVHKKLKLQDVESLLDKSNQLYTIPTKQKSETSLPQNIEDSALVHQASSSYFENISELSLRDNEKRLILQALKDCHGRISGPHGAAKKLGIPRSTLQYRMKKLNIEL